MIKIAKVDPSGPSVPYFLVKRGVCLSTSCLSSLQHTVLSLSIFYAEIEGDVSCFFSCFPPKKRNYFPKTHKEISDEICNILCITALCPWFLVSSSYFLLTFTIVWGKVCYAHKPCLLYYYYYKYHQKIQSQGLMMLFKSEMESYFEFMINWSPTIIFYKPLLRVHLFTFGNNIRMSSFDPHMVYGVIFEQRLNFGAYSGSRRLK